MITAKLSQTNLDNDLHFHCYGVLTSVSVRRASLLLIRLFSYGRFSVIPVGTKSIVNVVNFFAGPDGPDKFR